MSASSARLLRDKCHHVLQHSAPGSHGEQLAIRVVPGTGSGDLTGLAGAFEIIQSDDGGHSYVLEYTLA
ncbi:DUF3224 domain-containing protein [Micromonospora sp. LAH09]|uniref:DUF3224 domain-containing protein n=1 Tax=Micromonospora cabrerizensis TaxID=2911213 RepID=UPI001EE884B5|nr:DUF3224 domain-containing protein [Micromonospora cabrerizensis]MCG5468235.1 DUF3224 domain-containing protein [Micromonospora cabrerizensis]